MPVNPARRPRLSHSCPRLEAVARSRLLLVSRWGPQPCLSAPHHNHLWAVSSSGATAVLSLGSASFLSVSPDADPMAGT